MRQSFKNLLIVCALFFLPLHITLAQVGIGTTEVPPSAILEVSSQKGGVGPYLGFMMSRVPDEAARDAIATVPDDKGLLVFVIETGCIEMFDGDVWEDVRCYPPTPAPQPIGETSDAPPEKSKVKN